MLLTGRKTEVAKTKSIVLFQSVFCKKIVGDNGMEVVRTTF